MSDPIGTQGSGPRLAGDLDLAFQGGGDFLSRIRTMEAKRAQYEQALQEFQLGSSARQAFDQAAAKLKEADVLQKDAAAAMSDARAKATDIVQEAQARGMTW